MFQINHPSSHFGINIFLTHSNPFFFFLESDNTADPSFNVAFLLFAFKLHPVSWPSLYYHQYNGVYEKLISVFDINIDMYLIFKLVHFVEVSKVNVSHATVFYFINVALMDTFVTMHGMAV